MVDYLAEYKEYYKARELRYADNPNYSNALAAEVNISAAMQSCNELEEFKEKVGDLPDKCAFALMKDEYTMEQKHFEKHEEPFRKLGSDIVLEGLSSCSNVQDAITLALDAANKSTMATVADEYHREFIYNMKQLDQMEIYSKAEIPDKYKSEFAATVQENKTRMIEGMKRQEEDNRKFCPDWTEKPEICLENRHIRLSPLKEEHFKEQLSIYKSIINR